ncbi:MAG TPA: 4-hydroxythreonine-4-phosphate dehydrogenase PdxA [Flavobacteriaceae bacterium]|nr:4-hydroxythreonine-4-phosphate dehydrogenase PdxA [Flavobacteriaceae bacterium]
MKQDDHIILGISVGDLNGIGGEIILKTFEDDRMMEFCTPIVFASAKVFSFLKNHFKFNINFNGIHNMGQLVKGKINVMNVWKEQVDINFGQEDTKIGEYAIKSLEAATQALKKGEIDVLVTAPINKHNIQSKTFNFPGHTDYLAKELKGDSLMFMVADGLRVGLLTDHVPVKDVPQKIDKKLIQSKIETVYKSLVMDFKINRPKIAVLGINPHNGDNGVIGNEDDAVMKPTIKEIRESGKLVFGPYAADSFFGSNSYQAFDAVIASYHDQGLIPFKTLSFGQGVNFTAGLSKVRTSPDHGTAYEIAGKGTASESSFKEAVFLAVQVFRNREEYKELTENPLKAYKKQDFKKIG